MGKAVAGRFTGVQLVDSEKKRRNNLEREADNMMQGRERYDPRSYVCRVKTVSGAELVCIVRSHGNVLCDKVQGWATLVSHAKTLIGGAFVHE